MWCTLVHTKKIKYFKGFVTTLQMFTDSCLRFFIFTIYIRLSLKITGKCVSLFANICCVYSTVEYKKVVIQSSNSGIKSSADFWYGWLNHFVCHAYGGKIPRNHPGHQTTFCMGDFFFCCRFLEKRYAHSPLALLAPFPSQPQASWGMRFAGKRICIAHAKKPFALPMQKLKRLCIDQAKNKKRLHSQCQNCIANAKKKEFALPMQKINRICIANVKKWIGFALPMQN